MKQTEERYMLFLGGDFRASEFYGPTLPTTLSHLHSRVGNEE